MGGDGQVLNTTICDAQQHAGYLQWNLTASAEHRAESHSTADRHLDLTWERQPAACTELVASSPYLLPLNPAEAPPREGGLEPRRGYERAKLDHQPRLPGRAAAGGRTSRRARPPTGSFDRTYAWDITKDADKTTVADGRRRKTATINYTVTVHHDAGTDWQRGRERHDHRHQPQ